MSTLTLYNTHYSTCSQKVRMCLHEKHLIWEDRQIDLLKFEQLKPDYLAINPNGVVPALVDDGVPVVDSSVIIEYLDEAYPEPSLSPVGHTQRADMRAWMRYFEEVPTQAIRVPTFNALIAPRMKEMSGEDFTELTEAMPVRKQFYRAMDLRKGGFDSRDTQDSMERLQSAIARVAATVDSKKWLCGDQFSLADITLMPTVVRLHDLGLASLWDNYPSVARWFDDLQARESFDKTFYEGTRVKFSA